MINATTTQKYFSVARMEGVGCSPSNGSFSGRSWGCSSLPFSAALYHASAPMPASSNTKLTTDHRTLEPVGVLATSGSGGQFWV